MSLQVDLTLTLIATLTKALDLSTAKDPLTERFIDELTEGTGADQANHLFHDRVTIATGADDDYDLTALTDAFGDTVDLDRAKLIYVRNRSTTDGEDLIVGGSVSNGITSLFAAANDGFKVGPGGFALLFNPGATAYAVTASTADILRITSDGAADIDYDLIIVGVED